jgi:hypothetical protein
MAAHGHLQTSLGCDNCDSRPRSAGYHEGTRRNALPADLGGRAIYRRSPGGAVRHPGDRRAGATGRRGDRAEGGGRADAESRTGGGWQLPAE